MDREEFLYRSVSYVQFPDSFPTSFQFLLAQCRMRFRSSPLYGFHDAETAPFQDFP